MKTILLADDDGDDAETFQEALSHACPTAVFKRFEDGNQLLQYLESKYPVMPDLIFLDLNMPVMNGWQCLAAIKSSAKFKHVPVVIYTTSSNPRDREIAIDLKAHGLIIKPGNHRVLERILTIVVCKLDTTELKHAINDAYLLGKES
jgi:CheY-like chemotaxis protein